MMKVTLPYFIEPNLTGKAATRPETYPLVRTSLRDEEADRNRCTIQEPHLRKPGKGRDRVGRRKKLLAARAQGGSGGLASLCRRARFGAALREVAEECARCQLLQLK
jgi:hypothetical protein